jgi:tetratricopeptide (TPR) repeat protein
MTSIPQRLAWWFLGVGVGLGLAPASADADPGEDAKAHVARASQAHKEGRYDDARVELEAAYALTPKPELLYALGQVHAKLGRCGDATAYFRRFAAAQSDPQVAKVIDQAIAACKPAAAPPAAASTPGAPPANPAPPATAAPPEGARWYHDKLGDGLVLAGVTAAIVALVEYRSAVSDLDAAEDRTAAPTVTRYLELVGEAHDKRTTALVLTGVGGLLIAGGLAHYALRDRGAEVPGVAVAPAPGGGMVTYEGRF